MVSKKKKCDGCGESKFIWKNSKGKRYCKYCWSAHLAINKSNKTWNKPLPLQSPKRSKESSVYTNKRKEYLSKKPMCEAHISGICNQFSTDIHHMMGRTGDLYLNDNYWLAVCRQCHTWIELNPKQAIELGFSINKIKNE